MFLLLYSLFLSKLTGYKIEGKSNAIILAKNKTKYYISEYYFTQTLKYSIMDIKKLFIGGILGGILFFLLGWLIYGTLLMDFMKAHPGPSANINRAEADMDFLYLAIGNLLSGFLMAYIFVKANVNTLVNGFITAAVIGLLMSASYDCIMYATTTIASKKMMMADVIASTVMSGVVGAIVGMVMGKLNKPA